MNSLFDFVTHVKGVEYLLALSAIGIFIIFWEMLKDKPFPFLKETGKEDIDYLKKMEKSELLKAITRIVVAPIIGLGYILILPFAFIYMLIVATLSSVFVIMGKETAFAWRPMEAYLSGRKTKKSNQDFRKDALNKSTNSETNNK